MSNVLGIDAAWTMAQPSGVALISGGQGRWRCSAVAPSYDAFIARAAGTQIDWEGDRFVGSAPDARELLRAARSLAGEPVDVVTIDMPIATRAIEGRRAADNQVSRVFGGRGCSAHSPSLARPGPLGARLSADFVRAGYPVATASLATEPRHHLVEVYPHPALLHLLSRAYRVPYKVSKARRYWPALGAAERRARLVVEMQQIFEALARRLGPLPMPEPRAVAGTSAAGLKRYEDALDALVCAWVGILFLEGDVVALGDDTAAIWCPAAVVTPTTTV